MRCLIHSLAAFEPLVCLLANQNDTFLPIKKTQRTRKDPRAPKRSKSAYILFSIENRESVKAEIGSGARVGDIAKKTSQRWKALSDADRAHWEKLSKADRDRYQEEKKSYSGPLVIPGGSKIKKDPAAPKRPLTAFLCFSQKMRPGIQEKNPGWRIAEMSQELGRMWREMSEEERQPYIESVQEQRKDWLVENAKYKQEQQELAKQRKVEEERERKMAREHEKKSAKQHGKLEKQSKVENQATVQYQQRQFPQQDFAYNGIDFYTSVQPSGRDDPYMGMGHQYAPTGMYPPQDQGMMAMGYPGGMQGGPAGYHYAQQHNVYGESVAASRYVPTGMGHPETDPSARLQYPAGTGGYGVYGKQDEIHFLSL